ncbi:MAG TPA: hypothetical protein VK615_09045 [Candidatus Binatia bacterium]|nr:hypothetical protein [Candidatus Binatia bacterium]
MSINFAIALAVALVTVSCSHNVSRIRAHSLPSPNPTAYSFPLQLEQVYTNALQAFSIDHQVKQRIFAKSSSPVSLEFVLFPQSSMNAVSRKALFADPANAHDIYLDTSHTPFVVSPVYHGRYGDLPFIATFRLQLAGSASDTLVTVTAFDTEVINGTKFGIGSCGPGQHWNCVKVKPTTVEEYTILAYLGRYLGVSNMPPVILPAESVSSIKTN